MNEPLILKTNEKPTFFNKEAAIGFFIAPVLGSVIGGIIGKKRMEREATEGKLVGAPSAYNKDTLLGGMIGLIVGGIMFAAMAAAPILAVASIVLIPPLGAMIGGKHGKNIQEQEYAQAVQQQHIREMEKAKSQYVFMENDIAPGKSFSAEVLAERLRSANQQKEL